MSIDYDRQAYEAAAVLDRMMEGETSSPINVIARECGYSSSWTLRHGRIRLWRTDSPHAEARRGHDPDDLPARAAGMTVV